MQKEEARFAGENWKQENQKHNKNLEMSKTSDCRVDVGQLLDIKWKLGLAVSSDDCKNLSFPFVTMVLKTKDTSGQEHLHTVELTLTQFRNFSNQLQQMAKALEAV